MSYEFFSAFSLCSEIASAMSLVRNRAVLDFVERVQSRIVPRTESDCDAACLRYVRKKHLAISAWVRRLTLSQGFKAFHTVRRRRLSSGSAVFFVFVIVLLHFWWHKSPGIALKSTSQRDYASSYKNKKLSFAEGTLGTVQVAMIFDEKRQNFSRAVMRSLSFYTRLEVVYHLIAPRKLHRSIEESTGDLLGNNRIVVYDYELCLTYVRKVWFISKKIHLSAFCKIFLADIIHSTEKVLYIDSDTIVVQDVSPCWFNTVHMSRFQYIGMAVDMGGICQINPDHCYPIGFDWVIPQGLKCGTVPYRAVQSLKADPNHPCREPGDREPYQLNGGVILMDLEKMRTHNFTDKFVRASIYTWRKLNFRNARWGEQDLLNNFFRLYPETLYELDCGCNYQYSASRREVKCPGRSVIIAHGWTRQLLDDSSSDPYNLHFHYFRVNVPNRGSSPPHGQFISRISGDWTNVSLPPKRHTPLCNHQPHTCKASDRSEVAKMNLRIDDRVNVLTRTARRSLFFAENAQSVKLQTHPKVSHFVVTDDPESMSYLRNASAELIPSLYHKFDPQEVCIRCHGSDLHQCGRAPSPSKPEARLRFFDCYCSTNYPMNTYMEALHRRVSDGWIMYLDDDNLFMDKFAISEMLAHALSKDELLAFRSVLGRPTPLDVNFGRRIVMGDFDASNFAFHSKHIQHAVWGTKRCGDFRAASSLARYLEINWIDTSFIQAHPLRATLGGLGKRRQSMLPPVTVVITSHSVHGWRPAWLRRSIETYLSAEYEPVIERVILVWNNVDEPAPVIAQVDQSRLVVIKNEVNSLNNRWVSTLEHIKTDIVLNIDDDLYIKKEGIICMINWHLREPERMVSPFVRRIEENATYILDELKDSSPYTMVLPRAVMLPRSYLAAYSDAEYILLRDYVDSQQAHCDDVVLNIIALQKSGKPPLRVVLPRGTLVDFYTLCWTKNQALVGGLGLQVDRISKRSECVRHIMRMAGIRAMKETKPMGVCLPKGNAVKKVEYASPPRFDAMIDFDLVCEEDQGSA